MTPSPYRPHRSEQSLIRLMASADSWAERDEYQEQLKALREQQRDAGEARAIELAERDH